MRIGVDTDGVLINTTDILIELGMKYASKNNIKYELDSNAYSTDKIFKWGYENDYKFWETFYEDYYIKSMPTNESLNALRKLKELGHEIYIITARGSSNLEKEIIGVEKLQDITKIWYGKNLIPYDKLIFALDGCKSKICLENNIDVLIDDYSKNIKDVSMVMPVISFARPYNKDVIDIETNYKIYRSNNWNEIINFIEYRI